MNISTPYEIITFHQKRLHDWQHNPVTILQQGFLGLVEENHAFNYRLWQAEDRARRDDKGFEFVYQAKREIDHFNQQRNNFVEAIDQALFEILKPAMPHECTVHSETPGMIIDRLSILSLKIFYMERQTLRQDANQAHKEGCARKLCTLQQQHQQLMLCLEEFFQAIKDRKRTFRLYHQFKMYNDPSLNPQLYAPKD